MFSIKDHIVKDILGSVLVGFYTIFYKLFFSNEQKVLKDFPRLSICAVFKNEASYLKEWIEFHKLIGCERFFLYNNNSTDNFKEILEPYILSNEVYLFNFPLPKAQLQAYNHCLSINKANNNWLAFIDLDEFLFPTHEYSLIPILKEFDKFPGIVVNWIMFGSSNHILQPTGLVIENYTFCEKQGNQHIKTIVRPSQTRYIANAHCAVYKEDLYAVNENFNKVNGAFSAPSIEKLRINHYWSKSAEEFFTNKLPRGNADGSAQRKSQEFFQTEKITNIDIDQTIQKYLSDLKNVLGLT